MLPRPVGHGVAQPGAGPVERLAEIPSGIAELDQIQQVAALLGLEAVPAPAPEIVGQAAAVAPAPGALAPGGRLAEQGDHQPFGLVGQAALQRRDLVLVHWAAPSSRPRPGERVRKAPSRARAHWSSAALG